MLAFTIRPIFALFLTISFISAFSQVHVRGYYRSNGTYVQPYYRSSPDGNPYNNYNYPGNVNPYTGKVATGNPDTYLDRYYNRSNNSGNTTNTATPSIHYRKCYVTKGNAYARTGPAASYPVLTKLDYMDRVDVISTTAYPWYYARVYYYDKDLRIFTAAYAYVNGLYLTEPDNNGSVNTPAEEIPTNSNPGYSPSFTSYYVTANKLFARTGPSASSPVLATLDYMDKIEVISTSDYPWYYARIYYLDRERRIFKSAYAYVHSSFIASRRPADANTTSGNNTQPYLYPSPDRKQEDAHPYGEGYGKITLYSTSKSEKHISVFIDDVYAGQLNSYLTAVPECGAYGTLSITRPNGTYEVTAEGRREKWHFYVTIKEDKCQVQAVGN
jgi:uncharacterized protein YgiM (DUF1202 family)